MEELESDVYERWGEAMAGGYQILPNQLLRLQHKLGLSSNQIVILLNLSMHWWKKKDLPFPGPSIMARRMGVSRRTVERQLKELCDMELIEKKPLHKNKRANGFTMGYDLGGLVARLESMTRGQAKSGKLADRVNELRAAREADAAQKDMTRRVSTSSSELRG